MGGQRGGKKAHSRRRRRAAREENARGAKSEYATWVKIQGGRRERRIEGQGVEAFGFRCSCVWRAAGGAVQQSGLFGGPLIRTRRRGEAGGRYVGLLDDNNTRSVGLVVGNTGGRCGSWRGSQQAEKGADHTHQRGRRLSFTIEGRERQGRAGGRATRAKIQSRVGEGGLEKPSVCLGAGGGTGGSA